MREKKYANVVEEYEKALEKENQKKKVQEEKKLTKKEIKKDLDDEVKEIELSMTREMKFEDVRKQLEEDAALEEKIEELSSKKTKRLEKEIAELEEVEIPLTEKKKTTRRPKKEKINSKENITKTIEQLRRLDDTIVESMDEEQEKNTNIDDSELEELLNSVKKKKRKKQLAESDLENKEEDIFLTASLNPLKSKETSKKRMKVIWPILVIIIGLGALGYFVGLPIYHKYVDSRPKMIFDKTLDSLGSKYADVVKKLVSNTGDNHFIDFNFRINTNFSDLYVLSNYNFGYKFGINPNSDSTEKTIYLKDGKQLYGISYIRNNDKYYTKISTSDDYLDVTSEITEDAKKTIIDSLTEFYEVTNEISQDDMEYYINKHIEILKELLEKSLITASNDEIEVNGNKIKVVKNSFAIDRKNYERLAKKYVEFVNADSRLLKIDNLLNDIEDESQPNNVDELLEGINDDYTFIFNIYTINGTQVVGADAEEDGFRFFYYYATEDAFQAFIDLTGNDDCVNGTDCNLSKQEIIELSGKKDNNYNVEVKYNGQKLADLVVRSFTLDKIDLDYEVVYEEETYKGNLLLMPDFDKHNFNLDFSIKYSGEYINVNLFIDLEQNRDIGVIDEENVLKYSENIYKKELETLYKSMAEEGLMEGFEFWFVLMTSPELFDNIEEEIPEEPSQEENNDNNSMAVA